MTGITIYLSGKMSGRSPAEFEAEFNLYAEKYRAQGFRVISPVELDNGDYGDLERGKAVPNATQYRSFLARDMVYLLDPRYEVERIYMLPSWRHADPLSGSRLEKFAARVVGIPVFEAKTGQPLLEEVKV